MLDSFPMAVAAGAACGFLAGLGVGGGSLLILWLTLVIKMPPHTARALNLIFFLVSAGTVSLFRLRRGTLRLKNVLPAAIAGCIAAGICAALSKNLDVQSLQKFFGILLLVTGVRELFYRPRKFK